MLNLRSFVQIILICLISSLHLSGQENLFYDYEGVEREYIFQMPSELSSNAPLVFVLHGYTSNNEFISQYSGFLELGEQEGFAVCFPRGLADAAGNTHWNANLNISNVDDIGFLSSLASYLQDEHGLNPANTFSCGMSNGGFMSYTLACEAPDVFKAIASVTGTMSGYDWNNCQSENPIPVMQISGTIDEVVPMDGSITTFGGWGGAPDIYNVIDSWVVKNNCTELAVDSTSTTMPTKMHYHRGAGNQHEVWQYVITGMDHTWPGFWVDTGIDGTEEIWKFFSRYMEIESSANDLAKEANTNFYPNPVSSHLNVESSNQDQLTIYNNLGQILLKSTLSIGVNNIDVSHLEAGSYTLKVGENIDKFVKE